MFERLEGKKTYFAAAGGAISIFLYLIGVIEKDTMEALMALCGFGAAAGLRDAITKQ